MGQAAGTQAIGTESNIITGLAQFTWRGLDEVPYDMANAKGGWDLSPGEFPYVDGKSHDNMGRKEIPMSFRLLFINTVQPGVFPDLFNKWFSAIVIDGTPGKLVHPIIGEVDARVVDWDLELVATRTAGVVMTVNWTDTLLDPEVQQQIGGVVINVQAVAEACDDQMSDLGFSWPDGERTTSLLDMINQINGLIFSARLKAEGMINQALGVITRITDVVDQANSARDWALSANLKSLYVGMLDLQKASIRLASGRKTKLLITQRKMTLADVASEVGNKLAEIIGLNPTLLALPVVPKNTPVAYFA